MPVGAVDACVWGYPLVLFDAAASRNAQHDAALAAVTLPNHDLAFRIAWLDLRRGPISLMTGETTRYYALSLFDAWGRSFASLGTRTTGNERQTYAIVPPSWSGGVHDRIRTIVAPTKRIAAVAQTAKADGDIADLHVSIVPIGPRDGDDSLAGNDARDRHGASIADEIGRGGGRAFFQRLQRLIDDSGRRSDGTGWRYVVEDALRGDSKTLDAALREALDRIDCALPLTPSLDGWQAAQPFDPRGSAYLDRARSCRFHFLACDEQDVFERFTSVDAAGQPLHGANAYRLHFEAWNRPPARAFWSLSACDERFRSLPEGGCDSSVRSRDNLVRNPDDSLDVVLQSTRPHEPNANWLAVPERPFGLILRLYWPRPVALNGVWSPPALQPAGVPAR